MDDVSDEDPDGGFIAAHLNGFAEPYVGPLMGIRGWNTSRYSVLGKKAGPRFGEIFAAIACHFCLALPAAFMQPGTHLVVEPRTCTEH